MLHSGLRITEYSKYVEKIYIERRADYLDLYIIHRFDYDTPIEETMQALDDCIS